MQAMSLRLKACAAFAVVLLAVAVLARAADEAKPRFEQIDIWRDEFSKKCRGKQCFNNINMDYWSFALGDGTDDGIDITRAGAWGNEETQCYVNASAVAEVTGDPDDAGDGVLAIRAVKDTTNKFRCQNVKDNQPANLPYRAARLQTRGKRTFAPDANGTSSIFIEAKIRLPAGGGGMWAAFWMLADPANLPSATNARNACGTGGLCRNAYGPWPASGEIDIMEAVNKMENTIHTIHFATAAGDTANLETQSKLRRKAKWHTYGVEWNANYIRHYRDDTYLTKIASTDWNTAFYSNASKSAPFDTNFYIILNLAVGGRLPGDVSPSTDFGDQAMLIDYVRVYRETRNPRPKPKRAPLNGGQIALIALGGIAAIILFMVLSYSAWRNVVTLQRADSFSNLRKGQLTHQRPLPEAFPNPMQPPPSSLPLHRGRPQAMHVEQLRPYGRA